MFSCPNPYAEEGLTTPVGSCPGLIGSPKNPSQGSHLPRPRGSPLPPSGAQQHRPWQTKAPSLFGRLNWRGYPTHPVKARVQEETNHFGPSEMSCLLSQCVLLLGICEMDPRVPEHTSRSQEAPPQPKTARGPAWHSVRPELARFNLPEPRAHLDNLGQARHPQVPQVVVLAGDEPAIRSSAIRCQVDTIATIATLS